MESNDIELKKIDEFADLRNMRVLEVGCGDGRLSSFLAQKSANLTAIDIDPTRLEDARRMLRGVNFRLGSGESLEFPEASFDLVFFGFSLHHQNSFTALSEARRVLVSTGEILILEPTERSEYTKLVSVFEKEEPALLRRAAHSIASFGKLVTRQETFIVNHYFENAETFFHHYISSYGGGFLDKKSRHELQKIIGDKITESPINVEDQCRIILIQGAGQI